MTFDLNTNKMADPTLLSKARKARFDDLPNFSGHPSEDVERFLKSIKNITKATDTSENREILEIVRGKLTKSAGIWFDNNESTFIKWSDFETKFRNRYFSTTMVHNKFDKLKQRKQLHDESVTSYFDDVINLCHEIDSTMSEQMKIQHLMSGINPDFKRELSRRESSIKTVNEFIIQAKIEQDLYDTFEKTGKLSLESQQPQFDFNRSPIPSLTAMIKQPQQNYRNTTQDVRFSKPMSSQSSAFQRNSYPQSGNTTPTSFHKQNRDYSQQSTWKNKSMNNSSTSRNQFMNCKICGRQNHRTIDCFYKHTTGCFKCGQDHMVRDCTMTQNFQ